MCETGALRRPLVYGCRNRGNWERMRSIRARVLSGEEDWEEKRGLVMLGCLENRGMVEGKVKGFRRSCRAIIASCFRRWRKGAGRKTIGVVEGGEMTREMKLGTRGIWGFSRFRDCHLPSTSTLQAQIWRASCGCLRRESFTKYCSHTSITFPFRISFCCVLARCVWSSHNLLYLYVTAVFIFPFFIYFLCDEPFGTGWLPLLLSPRTRRESAIHDWASHKAA